MNSISVILGRPGEQNKTLLIFLDSQIGEGVGWEEDKTSSFLASPPGFSITPVHVSSRPTFSSPPWASLSLQLQGDGVAARPGRCSSCSPSIWRQKLPPPPFSRQPSAPRC